MVLGGIGIGQILYILSIKVTIKVFIAINGIITGYCFANTLEICFFYMFRGSYYSEYIACFGGFMIIAFILDFNGFNLFTSFNGGFFIVNGIAIIWSND